MTAPDDQSYADMCADHRNPRDPDVEAMTHAMRHPANARVADAECAENKGGITANFWAILARCVLAHQYADNGWRP